MPDPVRLVRSEKYPQPYYLLVFIHSIGHKKLDNSDFGMVSRSSRWQTIFKFHIKVFAKSLAVTKHV